MLSVCRLDFKSKRRNIPEKERKLLKETVQQEWTSYAEAERSSGLSHTTLWRYVRSDYLKAARVGRSMRASPRAARFPTSHQPRPSTPRTSTPKT